MLVLSRSTAIRPDGKKNNIVYITNKETQETITLSILDIQRGRVKIGLEDPTKNYNFLRNEVAEREGIEIPGIAPIGNVELTHPLDAAVFDEMTAVISDPDYQKTA